MKNTGIVITSLVGGLIVGSALTMLFTPHSRPEIKNFLDDEMYKMKDELEKLRCKCDEKGNCDCNE